MKQQIQTQNAPVPGARFFPDPKPVRTTVGSILSGILVEIDVVAYAGE